ncbi:hypothetical protein [Halobacillus massiliensis]|uniref:hypothetical protein n=1 Tax=Halobacillus massiliensis TaxID=1926286 RepID=UPI0009E20012|nr:hypothetical protein [Halobacillus massiliensis]
MKRWIIFLAAFLVLAVAAGCSSADAAEEEFEKYNNEDRIELFEKSEKITEMEPELINLYSEPEKAKDYVDQEILPLLDDVKSQAEEVDEQLETDEVKELHALFLNQVSKLTELFELQAELLELQAPPVSEEEQQQTEEKYPEMQQLSEEVDEIGQEYGDQRKELEEKYNSSAS